MARSDSAMRRGSSIRSIATIFAPVIVNATSVIGLPSAAVTMPTAPLISAGRVIWAIRVKGNARPATAAAPRSASAPLERTTTSGSRASSSASKSPLRAAWRKAAAAGQLAGRGRRAPHDDRDVLERDCEHVVQDECEPFGGRQRVQDYQQRG